MAFPLGGKYSFMSPVTNPVLSGVQRKQSSGFRIYYFPLVRSSFGSNSLVLMLASLEGSGAPGDFGHSVQLWSLLCRTASGAQQENTGAFWMWTATVSTKSTSWIAPGSIGKYDFHAQCLGLEVFMPPLSLTLSKGTLPVESSVGESGLNGCLRPWRILEGAYGLNGKQLAWKSLEAFYKRGAGPIKTLLCNVDMWGEGWSWVAWDIWNMADELNSRTFSRAFAEAVPAGLFIPGPLL